MPWKIWGGGPLRLLGIITAKDFDSRRAHNVPVSQRMKTDVQAGVGIAVAGGIAVAVAVAVAVACARERTQQEYSSMSVRPKLRL